MKSVTIIYNGAADQPLGALFDRTPLEVIRAANASRIAAAGRTGVLDLTDQARGVGHRVLAELMGMPSESVATLERGPLWAASLDEDISGYNFAYCANFVTLDEDDCLSGPRVAHLSCEETASLVVAVQQQLDADVLVRAIGPAQVVFLCHADEDGLHLGKAPIFKQGMRVEKYLGQFKKESKQVADWMRLSRNALANHSVNEVRVDLGENPASMLWLWDGGFIRKKENPTPATAILTNSPMAVGIANLLDIPVLPLVDPWNREADNEAFDLPQVVRVLREKMRLFIYVEAPGCLGTFGALTEKLRMLESIDHRLLSSLQPILDSIRPCRIALLSDSVVSTEEGVPVKGSVPLVLSGDGVTRDEVLRWSEADCCQGTLGIISRATLRHLIGF